MRKSDLSLLWEVFSYLGKKRLPYFLTGCLGSLDMAFSFAVPVLLQKLIRLAEGGPGGEASSMVWIGAGLLLCIPLICTGQFYQRKLAAQGASAYRKAVFAHAERLSLREAWARKTGEYITLITGDTGNAFGFLQGFTVKSLFQFLISFCTAFFVLLRSDARMLGIGLFLSVLSYLSSVVFHPRARTYDARVQSTLARSAGHLQDLTANLTVVKVYRMGEALRERFRRECDQLLAARMHSRMLYGLADGFLNLFSASAQAVSFIIGMFFVSRGTMRIDTLVLTAGYVSIMAGGVRSLGVFIKNLQRSVISARRIDALLQIPPEDERKTLQAPNPGAEYAIELDGVRFAYPGKPEVIRHLDLRIRPGERVGLAGESGCGKSTLIRLLQGFYGCTEGSIRLFGRPIEALSIRDVCALFAYVPQETVLFEGTIYENIALGSPDCTADKVYEAARAVRLHDFILSLPEGYRTILHEDGAAHSGGQKQRQAIARALVRDAPVLLLDEFTSALDNETEAEVLDSLRTLTEGRTVLMISHRSQTMTGMDRICRMEAGTIAAARAT